MKKAVIFSCVSAVLFALIAYYFISAALMPSFKTVEIATNDNGVVAEYIVGDGGATVATVHKVIVFSKQWRRVKKITLLVADHVDNIKLLWRGPDKLNICAPNARIFQFTNFFPSTPDDKEELGRASIYLDLSACTK